ncbi:MAG TPA: pilus assembly protein TadG-related protein [Acidisarcina sp.]
MSALLGSRAEEDRAVSAHAMECGQASVLLLSILGTFLLASVAFAVDMGNLWFHRQATQTAADAACEAGAMDMLYLSKGTVLPKMGFIPGIAGLCSTGVGGSICSYAAFNGYKATAGGLTNNSPSIDVVYSFPASNAVPGVTGASSVTYPLLKVIVEENVKTWFMSFVGKRYQVVAAASICGMSGSPAPPPLVVLSPTGAGTLSLSNSGHVIIQGGPSLGIQVNSSDPRAITFASSADAIDTHLGGPGANYQGTGSNVGVFGNEPSPGSSNFIGGSGQWVPNSAVAANPFANVGGPTLAKLSASPTSGGALIVAYNVDGCPDTSGCAEFKPGVYAGGIGPYLYWQTMIFDSGVYYMNGSIEVDSEIRLAKPPGWMQNDGVMFYFKTGTLHITNGSGNLGSRVNSLPSTALTCDATDPDPTHVTIPAALNGNIIVGPCTANGTYWDPYGDTTDSPGSVAVPGLRGLIVFHDPTNTYTPSPGSPSSGGNIDGGAGLTFAGSLYYHSTQYQTLFNISNAGVSGGLALGKVIADQVSVEGSGALKMLLVSGATTSVKAGVFQ